MKKTLMVVVVMMVMVMTGCGQQLTIGTYDSDLAGGSLYTPRGWEKISSYNAQYSIEIYKEKGIYGLTVEEL